MKTLEEILETGTDSEKELVKLVISYPIDREQLVRDQLEFSVIATTVGVVLTSLGIYLLRNIEEVGWFPKTMEYLLTTAGLLCDVVGLSELYTNVSVRIKKDRPIIGEKYSSDPAFFVSPMIVSPGKIPQYSATPAAVERAYCYRVFPVDDVDSIMADRSMNEKYLFLGGVDIEKISMLGLSRIERGTSSSDYSYGTPDIIWNKAELFFSRDDMRSSFVTEYKFDPSGDLGQELEKLTRGLRASFLLKSDYQHKINVVHVYES